MAFNRAGIEKAWNSVTSKAAELRQGAAGMIEGAKNSKAGGMVSDSAAAIHGIGLHTLGGAAMGGTINAAAYANDGAFTGADSGASAFLSGAGYGAAAGMGLGMMHAKKYAAYNAAKRAKSLKQSTYTSAKEQFGMAELPKEMSMKDSMAAFDTDLGHIRNRQARQAAVKSLGNTRRAATKQRAQQAAAQAHVQSILKGNPGLVPQSHWLPAPTGQASEPVIRLPYGGSNAISEGAVNSAGHPGSANFNGKITKPAFSLTRNGTAHDLAAQAYQKGLKNNSMPSYDERIARQRRLVWNNRTK